MTEFFKGAALYLPSQLTASPLILTFSKNRLSTPTRRLALSTLSNVQSFRRILVMGAIKSHPTPDNRQILARLLEDSDNDVSNAAKQVAADLKALAEMPVEDLVSQPKPTEFRK